MPLQAYLLTKILENAHRECGVPVTQPEKFSHLYQSTDYKTLLRNVKDLNCNTRLRLTIDHLIEQYRVSVKAFNTTRAEALQKLLKDKDFTASIVTHEKEAAMYYDLFAEIPATRHIITTKTGKYIFLLPVENPVKPAKPKAEKPRLINIVTGNYDRVAVLANRVHLPADNNRVFYIHRATDGKGYTVSDFITGFSVGGGSNKPAAIEKANSNIARYKPAEMAGIYRGIVEKFGIANEENK